MNTAAHYYLGSMGLGQVQHPLATTITGAVGSTAASIVPSILIAAGTVGGPIGAAIGAAIAGVTMAIEALINTGCGQTCVATSSWANQAAQLLGQNIAAYFALPLPRPVAAQQQALSNFDSVWSQLVNLCSQPGLGTAGKNCIADRQEGACHYTAAPPQYPGEPAAGACWNWFNAYRDPIANDTNVTSSAMPTGSTSIAPTNTGSILAAASGGGGSALLIGGLLLGFLLVMLL